MFDLNIIFEEILQRLLKICRKESNDLSKERYEAYNEIFKNNSDLVIYYCYRNKL